MKAKAITSVKEIKNGLYIRAFVNYLGHYSCYVEQVIRKPYRVYTKAFNRKEWKVDTLGFSGKPYKNFLSDFAGIDTNVTRLFPFSNELFVKLSNLSNFEFLEFINNKKFSLQDKMTLIADWEYERYHNEQMRKAYNDTY